MLAQGLGRLRESEKCTAYKVSRPWIRFGLAMADEEIKHVEADQMS